MGGWTVLKHWNTGDEFHTWHVENEEPTEEIARWYGCQPVVKEHQDIEPEVTVPEFTIAVSYQRGDVLGYRADKKPSQLGGWKWSICWTGKDGGRKIRTGYGFQTPAAAKEAAEHKAQQIALASLPEEVYTYTPEI